MSEALAKHPEEPVRTMACVLLRQTAAVRSLWLAIPASYQECVKNNLLQWCVIRLMLVAATFPVL